MKEMEEIKESIARVSPRIILGLALCLGVGALAMVSLRYGFLAGLIFSAVPLVLYLTLYMIKRPYWAYTCLFVVNYFIMGIVRYVPKLPGGVVIDALIMFSIMVLLIRSCYKRVGWERGWNGLSVAALVWLIYCSFELFNSMATPLGWATSIRGVAIYFFCISVLTPIFFYRFKDFKRILILWSVFTLLAVLKALVQKYHGFDTFEKIWLYESGGMTTHVIYSGIRYFSFYTDAGNFGSAMGLAMVVFSIAAIYFSEKKTRLYFLGVALAAGYGMMLSGTRGALAVPFAGYLIYLLISRQKRIIFLGAAALLSCFVFLKYTDIGQGNAMIRRMRSAFDTEDASLNVRLNNQKRIAEYIKDKPFGSGLGMGGGKAKAYAPTAYLSQIPTDSWFVMIWVETGIIGLVLHLGILFYILFMGCYLVLFKLKDKRLRGLICAVIAGIFGVMVSAYGNEILGQLPTGIIIYMCAAFIFLSPRYDRELLERRSEKDEDYEHHR